MRTSVLIVAEAPAWQERFQASVCACAQTLLVGVAGSCAGGQALLDLYPIHVAVMDLGLSSAQGLAFLRYVAQRHPRTQVLVVPMVPTMSRCGPPSRRVRPVVCSGPARQTTSVPASTMCRPAAHP